MKIDKKNPFHWLALMWSGAWLLAIIPLRVFRRRNANRPVIVFYGHTLNGNLLALYNHWSEQGYECRFLLFDTLSKMRLMKNGGGVNIYNAYNPRDLLALVKSNVFISSHGLHHFSLLRKLTTITFIDVFHAPIFFKGFDSDDFRHLHESTQVWVSSEKVRDIYIDKFGFEAQKVKVTGSARVESIKEYVAQADDIKAKHGLSSQKKTVLVAPTWKQDAKGRSIIPFNLTLSEFLTALLQKLGDDVQIIFRAHLNSGDGVKRADFPNVFFMPYSEYPNAEEFLAISDVLISDWSSIVFDYLVCKKPIIFLDVEAPFAKGFTVGPEYRCGEVVASSHELSRAMYKAVYEPSAHLKAHKNSRDMTQRMVFGNTLDGNTYNRCDMQLHKILQV